MEVIVISGIDGGICILESTARLRLEKKMISKARIIGEKGNYVVEFHGSCAEWNDQNMVLCSSRNPYEPRVFKSLDGAISQLFRIGLTKPSIIVERS